MSAAAPYKGPVKKRKLSSYREKPYSYNRPPDARILKPAYPGRSVFVK
jgi:hypothetical protein